MYKKITHHITLLQGFITTSRQAFVLLLEMLYGAFLTVSSIFLFLKIRSEVLESEFMSFDIQIVQFFYKIRSPFVTELMHLFSFLGGELAIGGAIILSIFFLYKRHKREAFLMIFILSMAQIINVLLKHITQRDRPQYYPLVLHHDYSFPSGHAMISFVFYATIAYFIFHFTRNKNLSLIISASCLALIGLVGISRIYLGVHYPSDVIAGYFGGLAWFTSVLLIEKTFVFFKLFRERNI